MQAMAPATMDDVMSAPWGYTNSWGSYNSSLDPSVAWQTYRPQKKHTRERTSSKTTGSFSSATGSFTTIAPDSATTSLNTFCSEDVGEDDKNAARPSTQDSKQTGPMTTVMVRNIPTEYTRDMLIELMNSEGFEGDYDFLYLPIDFSSSNANGYAFVNFTSPDDAQRFQEHFKGFSKWAVSSENVCDISWSNVLQGLAAHVDRYRSSPVMHEEMPDECKPVVFSNGVRAPFPPPLKKVRAPRIRHSKAT